MNHTDHDVLDKVRGIQNICAVGAGAMGAGMALIFAMSGRNVEFYARREQGLQDGMEKIHAVLGDFFQRGLLEEARIPEILARIHPGADLNRAASKADFVIESVAEDLKVKQSIFAELDKICPSHTIFATNTSSLGPTSIASVIDRKDRFIVTHFWNPPHLIPLVEVVPGEQTSQESLAVTFQLMKNINKVPVLVKRDVPGFIGNRLQVALLREALHLLKEGIASAEDIDLVVRLTLGRRLAATGPLESLDLGGHHIFKGIYERTGVSLCGDTGVPAAIEKNVEDGNLGIKTGAGIYKWSPSKVAEIRRSREDELFRHLAADAEKQKPVHNMANTDARKSNGAATAQTVSSDDPAPSRGGLRELAHQIGLAFAPG